MSIAFWTSSGRLIVSPEILFISTPYWPKLSGAVERTICSKFVRFPARSVTFRP